MRNNYLSLFLLFVLTTSLLIPNQNVKALPTTWYVKSTADGPATPANCPGNGCRLRDAIAAAAPGDIIRFTLPINSTITTTNGDFSISKELTIQAAPSNHLTIHGNDAERIFFISSDPESITNVVIEGLTLTHGHVLDNHGGAIFNQNANVTLNNMVITQNTITDFGVGGAISNFGVMTISNSQITNNTAPSAGGIFSGFGSTLNMTNVTVSGNQTNWVNGETGGVSVLSDSGASLTSTVNFDQVYIINNISATGAGGLQIGNSANATITNSSISGNAALRYAGMQINSNANVTISNTTISNNQALNGNSGGIFVLPYASLTMTDSTISGNSASGYGGGLTVWTVSTVTLERVTVSGNSASEGSGMYINDDSTANLTNVTVTGNTASNRGGGMLIYGAANLNNVTVAGNSATNNTGGILTAGVTTINIKNSIIADNTAPSLADCNGTLNSQGYNLFENVDVLNCVISGDTSTNMIGVDPMLDSLLDNGGSTLTMGLLPGSPAIDSADNTTCASEDQRTYLRPQDGDGDDTNVCDMGALEYAPYPVVFSITRANPNPTFAASVDYSVKFSEPVVNVDLADFDIAATGVTGANISTVIGSGQDYTVTVNTGTGNGTIQLELIDDDSILSSFSGDSLGGPGSVNGSASGEMYSVAKPTPIDITIGGVNRGTYNVAQGASQRVNYAGLDAGPVVVDATNDVPIIAALRDAYYVNGQVESFVQLMGLPEAQISTKYYFPAYNNVTLDGQLRFGNVGNSNTTVTVTIAGVVRGTYDLTPGQAKRVNYTGLDAGPVIVESSGGVPIIAALRDAYFVNGQIESFAQLMGLPSSQLSDTYYFPAYNNVTLNEQLRIGNVDTVPTTVTVTIAGVVRGTYPLDPNEAVRINYAGLDAGPVVVQSSGGAKIIAALRDAYFVNGQVTSFVQLMGLPLGQLSTKYYFPAYNNVTLDGQLRFGNVGNSNTTVTVTIGGVVRGTYNLTPGQAQRVNYTGLDAGPVIIESSGGVPIIAALRDAYFVNGLLESFAQLMGLPDTALSPTYYFPAYNNVTLNGQLRFGVP